MTRAWLALVLVAAVLPAPSISAEDARDSDAVSVAKKTLRAMGGQKAFDAVRTLTFDFVAIREGKEAARYHHVWDRSDGRYRVEGKNREGQSFRTVLNVNKPETGRAWLDGTPLEGDALKQALERGYGRFINDTYWLLMPAKMLDPGVSLASEPDVVIEGTTFEVVRLTFGDGVGLTPKDTYWAYVSKTSSLMERWEFVLTGQQAEDRAAYSWTDWTEIGGVKLALTKTALVGSTIIRFDNVSASSQPNDAAFE